MPFDGAGFATDDRVSKIDQVIDLLASPDKWCKGSYRTPDGRFCIRGAMRAIEGGESLKPVVLQAICDMTDRRYRQIESFNDQPDTKHAEVLRVLQQARHLMLSGWTPDVTQKGRSPSWSALLQALRATLLRHQVGASVAVSPPAG
jgi:hypothetical protein